MADLPSVVQAILSVRNDSQCDWACSFCPTQARPSASSASTSAS